LDETNNLLERLRDFEDIDSEPTAEAVAKREVAAQLRGLADAIGASGASAQQMREVAEQLSAQCAILATTAPAPEPGSPDTPASIVGMEDFRDRSPMTGLANPIAPPISLAVDLESERVVGEMKFGSAYEGAPGIVHGGFVAAAFDEVLGFVQSLGGSPGMTGTLTVRYQAPTPLPVELVLEAELSRSEGRKIFTEGRIRAGDVITATAQGLFISVDRSRMEALAKARDRAEARRSG